MGLLLVFTGLGMVVHFGNFGDSQSLNSIQVPNSSARLYKAWKKDLKALKKKKQLPAGFDSIKEISYTPLSSMAAQWMSHIRVPVSLSHKGKYKLNLEVDHWVEKQKAAAVVHYQLVDIASGNTVWEFGRTYPVRN